MSRNILVVFATGWGQRGQNMMEADTLQQISKGDSWRQLDNSTSHNRFSFDKKSDQCRDLQDCHTHPVEYYQIGY